MRRLLHPCSIRRPQRLPSSYPSSGLMSACVRANSSPVVNKFDRLGSPGPLHCSGIYLCRTHLERGISQQVGRTTEALGRWETCEGRAFLRLLCM